MVGQLNKIQTTLETLGRCCSEAALQHIQADLQNGRSLFLDLIVASGSKREPRRCRCVFNFVSGANHGRFYGKSWHMKNTFGIRSFDTPYEYINCIYSSLAAESTPRSVNGERAMHVAFGS